MQLSARSYLAAGLSLTTAGAIALTPIAVPANDRVSTVPNVTVSEIQLTVTPADIQAFFSALQSELAGFNESIAAAVALPGDTLADGLLTTIGLTDSLYNSLRSATTNATLLALLDALQATSDNGLYSLLETVELSTGTIYTTTDTVLNLVTSAVTGSLSNVLSAVVAVANNPLSFANYAGLLGAGVATGQLLADNSLGIVHTLGTAGLEFAEFGVEAVWDQIDNAVWSVRGLMDVAAGATGSQIIEAVNAAVQSIFIAPVQLGIDLPFWVADETLYALQVGFDEVFAGLIGSYGDDPGTVNIIGGSLQDAIGAIGNNPLDPSSYLFATAALLAGGFATFNESVQTVGNVAQLPFQLGVELINPVPADDGPSLTTALTGLNTEIAVALSNLLTAVGLPETVANLPLAIAGQLNAVINAGAAALTEGLVIANNLVADTSNFVIDVSNQIESTIFGVLPGAGVGAAPSAPPALSNAREPDPSGDEVAVVDDTGKDAVENTVTDEDTVSDKTPADDEASDDNEAPTADDADDADNPDDDNPDDKGSYASKNDDRKAAREARKTERDSASDNSPDGGATA